MIERDLESFEDVGALFGLPQLVGRPPDDDLLAEVDEGVDQLSQREDARLVVVDREEDDPERLLELGVLVKVVQDDVRDLAAPQLDHHPHPAPVGLVADVRDAVELLVLDEPRNLLDE